MLEGLWLGISALVLDPQAIALFVGGLVGGLAFGAIPGLSALTLVAILLPLTAYMPAAHGIMLFSVIYVSGVYGGAVTAILFNIPGAPENAPTAFDGYPLAQRGEAGRAIGAAVVASAIGGTLSAIVMIAATPLIANWAVRAFGPPELFGLIAFGIAVAASVGGGTLWKGWLSVAFGLLLATIGADPAEGISRFSFGSYYLMAGINYVPLLLGAFAVAEVFVQGARLTTGMHLPPTIGVQFPKLIEFWRLRIALLRSTIIGFFSGILPGIGAVLAAFLSYNEAVRWSRHPERFGKGELEGVVASETANNAATSAAMIPLLALGLPGGALTAIMMGVFQIHGMSPGPLIFITDRELVWITFVAILLANICILGLGYFETKTVVHLLRIPFRYLGPGILVVATIGAYALRNLMLDVWVMFIAGVVAYFLRQTGFSIPAIVLGLILGRIGESAYVKSAQMMDYDLTGFLDRPIAALLLALAILTVLLGVLPVRRLARAAARAIYLGGRSAGAGHTKK